MDVAAALKNEFFRPFVTILVPGSTAIAPYILVAAFYAPQCRAFWDTHPSAASIIIAVAVVSTGLVLENIGSFIEVKWWDAILQQTIEGHLEEWEAYLRLYLRDELIGQRYLRDVLTRMKFELTMGPALLASWVGLIWMNTIYQVWSYAGLYWLSVFMLCLSIYLIRESFKSARVLSRVRHIILEATRQFTR